MTENDLKQLQQYGAQFAGDDDDLTDERVPYVPCRVLALSEIPLDDTAPALEVVQAAIIKRLEAERDNEKRLREGYERCFEEIEEVVSRWFQDDTLASVRQVVAERDALVDALRPFAQATESAVTQTNQGYSRHLYVLDTFNNPHVIDYPNDGMLSINHLRNAAAALEGKAK